MKTTLQGVIRMLETHPREGSEADEPEGARFIKVSDTLALEIASHLRATQARAPKVHGSSAFSILMSFLTIAAGSLFAITVAHIVLGW